MNKNRKKGHATAFQSPLDESLTPAQRTELCVAMSELVLEIATHVICHTLVDYQELLAGERLSIAHAFLQRATSTHLCNHKLTTEGIVYEYKGQPFLLHEEFKTMTLTRSVYEHLAMFYFLYEHPRTVVERDIVWKYWQINSKKNRLDYGTDADKEEEQQEIDEINKLRDDILQSYIGQQCYHKLDEWTKVENPGNNGSIEFIRRGGHYDVRRVSYSQAWKYLFNSRNMTLLYSHLSMHCHPVYSGLVQYQNQAATDEGDDAIPLYFSCSFLAYLCRLFLKQIPNGQTILASEFSSQEQQLFHAISLIDAAPSR